LGRLPPEELVDEPLEISTPVGEIISCLLAVVSCQVELFAISSENESSDEKQFSISPASDLSHLCEERDHIQDANQAIQDLSDSTNDLFEQLENHVDSGKKELLIQLGVRGLRADLAQSRN
jgi:hypothetical protein